MQLIAINSIKDHRLAVSAVQFLELKISSVSTMSRTFVQLFIFGANKNNVIQLAPDLFETPSL
jgi:hypothetical protein